MNIQTQFLNSSSAHTTLWAGAHLRFCQSRQLDTCTVQTDTQRHDHTLHVHITIARSDSGFAWGQTKRLQPFYLRKHSIERHGLRQRLPSGRTDSSVDHAPTGKRQATTPTRPHTPKNKIARKTMQRISTAKHPSPLPEPRISLGPSMFLMASDLSHHSTLLQPRPTARACMAHAVAYLPRYACSRIAQGNKHKRLNPYIAEEM